MRKISSTVLLMFTSLSTFAGGLLTNTNQNVAFLRNPSRDAAIGIDGVYSNPAGVSFMKPGWHLSLNFQSAYQTRTINSTYQMGTLKPFALGEGNSPSGSKEFKGEAKAPVVPSFQMAWVGKKWTFSGGLAVTGGGGKATFDDGLGSFESQVAALPALINTLTQQAGFSLVDGYSADMYMKGRQYYYGMQAGIGYRITDNLSAYVGGRLILADCNYYGYVKNIKLHTTAAGAAVGMPAGNYSAAQVFTGLGYPHYAALVQDRALDCDQSGWTFMTVLGLNYKIQKWNFAARYEFKGRMHLKNQANNTSGVAEFDDGKKNWAEVPALLTLGAEYSILPNLRVSAGYHHFFDKQAAQYERREDYLENGTNEYLAGVEYDINKHVTVSAGYQSTNYGIGKDSKFISDISFVTSSNSVGLGAEIHVNKKLSVNVAYFKTFYKTYTKHMDDYDNVKATLQADVGKLVASDVLNANELQAAQSMGAALSGISTAGTDKFKRTNDVLGLGINFDF